MKIKTLEEKDLILQGLKLIEYTIEERIDQGEFDGIELEIVNTKLQEVRNLYMDLNKNEKKQVSN